MTDYTSPKSILESVSPQQLAVENAISSNCSDIQKFYNDSTILLTGATGFLGKTLLEKLFRSTNVKKMFILIRDKKGKCMQDRLNDILRNPVYDILRQKKPNFSTKIVCVKSDIGDTRLGISDENWKIIVEEVDVIFHMAATTKFDEKLRLATFINVRGTREILRLGRECRKLRALVHASTAFAHTTPDKINKSIFEQFYPSPVPPKDMITMAETLEDNEFYQQAAKSTVNWPNTYTFTKALGEELVRVSGDLPICIIRPPYVICTYYDPIPGWLDFSCVYGPSGLTLATGLGFQHVSLNKPDIKLSMCPVDFVSNATIAAGFACGTAMSTNEDVMIYSLLDSNLCIQWMCDKERLCFVLLGDPASSRYAYNSVPDLVSELHVNTRGTQRLIMESEECLKIATPKAVWYAFLLETSNDLVFWVLTWLLHYIPAYMLDCVYFLTGMQKPKNMTSFVQAYTKLYQSCRQFKYFLTNKWYFDNTNLRQLYKRLSENDKVIYNFDFSSIDWKQLIFIWLVGLRKHIVQDGLIEDGSGYRKQLCFMYANYIFFGVYIFVVWQIVYTLFTLI